MSDKEIIAQQAETIQLLKEVLKNLSGRGNNGFDPEITFGQCVDMYLKHLEKCAKTSSYFSAQCKCSRLERFNDMPVCDINKADIQNFVDEIAGHYAPKTVKESITQMKTILNYAAKMDLIPDKTFIVDMPRIEKKEYRVLNTKEYNKLRMKKLHSGGSGVGKGVIKTKLNKEKFMKTELGGNLEEVITSWDICLSDRPVDRDTANWCQAQWEVYKIMFRQMYGIDYAFTRTDDYFGIVNEDDYNDWLMRFDRTKQKHTAA